MDPRLMTQAFCDCDKLATDMIQATDMNNARTIADSIIAGISISL